MAVPTICESMATAVADVPDDITLLIPGFGPGSPINLMTALYHQGAKGLTTVSNGAGGGAASTDGRKGLGDFIEAGRVRKIIAAFTAPTHPSRASTAVRMVLDGSLEAELVPQGSIAERVRAGGAGIPAFYTPAGVGTLLAEGKEHRDFGGKTYTLEHAIFGDYAFIRAWKADTAGNLVYKKAGRNFNPVFAMGAKHVFVEVEEIVPAGTIPADQIHTPGIYVERIVQISPDGYFRMERPAAAAEPAATHAAASNGKRRLTRDEMTEVIARRLPHGWVVNLGVGIPTLVSNFVEPEQAIVFTSENGVIGYAGVASEAEVDFDVVNAGGQFVTLTPGAAFVHHADSFALIRRGMNDVTVLGAYEVATDGSFANWRTSTDPFDQLGGIGGAMDLAHGAREVWLAMEHTTREGASRLLERCTLPVTGPGGVALVVTDLAVVAVRDGRFILEEHAPGYTVEEIQALTGAPLSVSPALREVTLARAGTSAVR